MEIRKSYLEMIKKFPGGWDAMCGALATTRDALENRIYERKGQSVLVDLAMQIQTFSGTTYFAESVATASGGTFVKLPEGLSHDNEPLGKKFREVYINFGRLVDAYEKSVEDGEIDRKEKADIKAKADEVQKAVSELVAMAFRAYCKPESESAQ